MNETTHKIAESIGHLDFNCAGRRIDKIVLHCSATPEGRDVSAADIRLWHVRDRGFADIGYHFVIRLDGTVEQGRPLAKAGAHCRGHNRNSIGVCYIGGADSALKSKDTRTPAQREAMAMLLKKLQSLFPAVTVWKHRELSPTACPGF